MKTTMNQIKYVKRGLILCALFIVTGLASCKKEDASNPEEGAISVPSDADGYLIATRTSENGSSATFNQSSAAFSSTPGVRGGLVNVGTVKCNSVTCTSFSNAYASTSANFTSGNLSWEITGGNGFGAFNRTGLTFPSKPVISSSTHVTKSGFSVTNNAVSGADRLLYTIGSQATPSKLKLKWSSSTSATSMAFSGSDLSGFTVGEEVGVIVTAYKVVTETLGGKKIYIQIASQDIQEGVIN